MAMPFLRILTNQLCKMVNLHTTWGWDHVLKIPQEVKDHAKQLKTFLVPFVGRSFPTQAKQNLWSDSSTYAWGGGLDSQSGTRGDDNA